MQLRRFQLVPLLFIIASTILLSGLGTWQLYRLQWKNALIAQIDHAQHEPSLGNLPELNDDAAIAALAYRNVTLTGTFMHDKTLHMAGRPKEAGIGTAAGFFLLTPFKLDDDGRIILVNRGFSLVDKETKPTGTQTIQGVIRTPRVKRPFSPDNHPEKNVWFFEDINAMSQFVGSPLLPLVVEAVGKKEKNVYPIPNDGKISLRNDHLYYAITWFSIAIIGIIMFIIYHRKPRQ